MLGIDLRGSRRRTAWLCLALSIGLEACAPISLYQWGDYETSLHSRYVQEDLPRAETLLRETITAAERGGNRVPPGAYADYGFLLYRRKEYEGAIRCFEKEKAAFPESVALMTRIVERVRQQQKGQPAVEGEAKPPEGGKP